MWKKIGLATAAISMVAVAVMQLPNAAAATKVDYFTGYFECSGTLRVSIQNQTSSPATGKVTFRFPNGALHTPTTGDGTLQAGSSSADFTDYNCTGSASGTLQVRTSSTRVVPAATFTIAGGPATFVPAGAWRMSVHR